MSSRQTPLTYAQIEIDEQQIPVSQQFGDVYHSRDGAVAQSYAVFLQGNALPERWLEPTCPQHFTILEVGFGLGINFIVTAQAWLRARAEGLLRPEQRLHYVAIEKHPIEHATLLKLHEQHVDLQPRPHDARPNLSAWTLSQQLVQQWPEALAPGPVPLQINEISLQIHLGDANEIAPNLKLGWHALYLDGFAPKRNPEAWSNALLKALARRSLPDATLATWAVSGAIRQSLADQGYVVERQPGFGRKKHRLTGTVRYSRAPVQAWQGERHAVVIGAGLAGCAVADELSARGWAITLIDRGDTCATGASGNPAGTFHQHISRDDAILSRLTRVSQSLLLQSLSTWRQQDPESWERNYRASGHLQLGRSLEEQTALSQALAAGFVSSAAACALDAETSSLTANLPIKQGGILFHQGGAINPSALCQHWWQQALGAGATWLGNTEVQSLDYDNERQRWNITIHSTDRTNTESTHKIQQLHAPLVVVATAMPSITPQWQSCMHQVRGQITFLTQDILTPPSCAISGSAYLVPPLNSTSKMTVLGATYDRHLDPLLRIDSHLDNLNRLLQSLNASSTVYERIQAQIDQLKAMVIDPNLDSPPPPLAGRVGFRAVTRDRLPVIGAAPAAGWMTQTGSTRHDRIKRHPGLWLNFGYGSRGLLWSRLGAHIIASQLEGTPTLVDERLLAAIDPARPSLK